MEEHIGQERGWVGQDERCVKHEEGQPDKGGDRLSKRELKRNPGTADGAIRVREVGELNGTVMVASGFCSSKEPDAVMCSRCSACAGRVVAEEALATMFEGCGRETWPIVFHVDGECASGTLVMLRKAKCYAHSASRMVDSVRDNIGNCALNRLGFNENARAPEGVVAYDAQLHPRSPCERDDLSFKMLRQAGGIDALPGSLGCLSARCLYEELHVSVDLLATLRCILRSGGDIGKIAIRQLIAGTRLRKVLRFLCNKFSVGAYHGERRFEVVRERCDLVALCLLGAPARFKRICERIAHAFHRCKHVVNLAHIACAHSEIELLLSDALGRVC